MDNVKARCKKWLETKTSRLYVDFAYLTWTSPDKEDQTCSFCAEKNCPCIQCGTYPLSNGNSIRIHACEECRNMSYTGIAFSTLCNIMPVFVPCS